MINGLPKALMKDLSGRTYSQCGNQTVSFFCVVKSELLYIDASGVKILTGTPPERLIVSDIVQYFEANSEVACLRAHLVF